jgi:predicted RecA/RadA family phage recombinase
VVSGQFIVVGALAGVCQHDAKNGAPVEVTLDGVWSLAKAAVAITAGQQLYWEGVGGTVTTVAAGNALIGAAVAAAADTAPTVAVRLNGVTVA